MNIFYRFLKPSQHPALGRWQKTSRNPVLGGVGGNEFVKRLLEFAALLAILTAVSLISHHD